MTPVLTQKVEGPKTRIVEGHGDLTSTMPTQSVNMTGYDAWVRDLLHPDTACKLFAGYREALDMIKAKREALIQQGLRGFSPGGNLYQDGEFPFVAALLLKAAFGRDCLQDGRKRRFILDLHPEFRVGYKLGRP